MSLFPGLSYYLAYSHTGQEQIRQFEEDVGLSRFKWNEAISRAAR
jgi:hypothetical protein